MVRKKSVKLTNGKKTGIFYYIQNKSNSVSGYVWRNYLTKGAYKSSATPTRASLSEAEIVKQVMNVLPGTVYDASLQKIADSNIAHDGDVYANMQEALPKNEQSNFAMLGFDYFDNATLLSELKAGKISYDAYSKQLLTENLTAQLKDKGQVFYSLIKGKTINDFSGWHIAVSAILLLQSTLGLRWYCYLNHSLMGLEQMSQLACQIQAYKSANQTAVN